MTPSPELVAFVADWEGFRSAAYQDVVGIWTVGYGFTLGVQPGDTMTLAEANAKLEQTLYSFGKTLESFMQREPSQPQFDALLSLAYNCGVGRIGRSGVMDRFNRGDDEGAAERITWWNKAGGREVAGLTRRRAAERAIYERGDYSGRP